MEATLRVPLAKTILRGLEAIAEEGILSFDKDGMNIILVDGNRYKMLRTLVPATAFQSYRFGFSDTQRIGVIFARMGSIVKTLTAKDELTLALDQPGDNLRFRLLANGISQTVKLLRLDLMNDIQNWPQMEFDYQATIPGKNLKDFLKTTDLVFRSNSQDEPVVWKHPLVDFTGKIEPTLFTTEEVSSALTAVSRSDLAVRGSNSSPVEFDWTVEDCRFTALVANRK
jgi:hypothetical protein